MQSNLLPALALSLLCVIAPLNDNAVASLNAPQRSLRGLGGRQVWVPICSRRGINGSAAYFDATDTASMDQVMCYAPSWGTVTAVKLVYAAFDMPQQGEVDRAVTATLSNASVFVPNFPSNLVYTSSPFSTSSTFITCSPTAGAGCNAVSVGQLVSSAGSYFAGGTYVTSVINGFAAGAGNQPIGTQINLSASPTANNSGGLQVTFAGKIVPARWGGNKGVVITPAHDVVTSDPITLSLPPNSQFFVRTSASMSGPGMQISDYPGGFRYSGSQVEFDARGAALNDHTMDPTNLANTGGGFWGPAAVLGLVTPNAGATVPGSVLVLGDSIATGTGDLPDSFSLQGYIQRSMENNIPFVTAARGSTTALEEAFQGAGQFALATDTGITDVMLELGRNDIQQFTESASALQSYISIIAQRYDQAGKRVWCFTVPPTTISSDGWTTLSNQSWIASSNSAASMAVAGATTIVLSGTNGIAAGQVVVIPPLSQSLGNSPAPSGATSVTVQSIAGLSVGQAVYGPGIAPGTAITGISGLAVALSAPVAIAVPAFTPLTFGTAISPGTTVLAVNTATNVITLSNPIVSALAASTTIYTGSQVANVNEMTREAYNSYLRSANGLAALGCYGLIDDDAYMADLGGSKKWRIDLGAASIDGVHPAAALHGAVVAAGIIAPGMFYPP